MIKSSKHAQWIAAMSRKMQSPRKQEKFRIETSRPARWLTSKGASYKSIVTSCKDRKNQFHQVVLWPAHKCHCMHTHPSPLPHTHTHTCTYIHIIYTTHITHSHAQRDTYTQTLIKFKKLETSKTKKQREPRQTNKKKRLSKNWDSYKGCLSQHECNEEREEKWRSVLDNNDWEFSQINAKHETMNTRGLDIPRPNKCRINKRNNTYRHVIIKQQKTKDDKSPKERRKGKYFIHKIAIRTKSEKKKKIESAFSLESMQARGNRGI